MDATKKESFKKKQKETGVSRRKEKWIVAAKSTDNPSIGAREKGTLPKLSQPLNKIDEGPDYPISIELVGNIKDETPLKAFETKDFKENEMENYVGSYTTDGKVWSLSFA